MSVNANSGPSTINTSPGPRWVMTCPSSCADSSQIIWLIWLSSFWNRNYIPWLLLVNLEQRWSVDLCQTTSAGYPQTKPLNTTPDAKNQATSGLWWGYQTRITIRPDIQVSGDSSLMLECMSVIVSETFMPPPPPLPFPCFYFACVSVQAAILSWSTGPYDLMFQRMIVSVNCQHSPLHPHHLHGLMCR